MKSLSRVLSGIAACACALCMFVGSASAKLPENMDEFEAKFATEAKTPEGAVKLWLEAAFLYQDSATRNLGRNMLLKVMKNLPQDFERNSVHATMVDRIKNLPEVQRSFCAGSSPENNYKADPNNCELTISKSKEGFEDGYWNVFLISSGADSPRQVTLYKDGDHLVVSSAAALYMSIKPAKKK